MLKCLRGLSAAAVFGVAALYCSPAHATQEAARRYFKNGVELLTASPANYQDAYYQFQLAYRESSQSWKVLGNLGLCAMKLERDEEAVSYYEDYLEQGRAEIPDEERSAIEQDLLLLKGNLATVRLTSSPAATKVLDQRSGSSAPTQAYAIEGGAIELKLRAGTHTLTVMRGEQQLTWNVVLEPKSIASHLFDFNPTHSSGAAAAPSHAATGRAPEPPATAVRTGAYVALGLGGVGAVLGGVFFWESSQASSKADSAFACDQTLAGCSQVQRDAVQGDDHDANAARIRGFIALGAGGAALATGVLLLVLPRSSKDEHSAATLTPWVGAGAVGVSGRF